MEMALNHTKEISGFFIFCFENIFVDVNDSFDWGDFLSPRQNFVVDLRRFDVFQSFSSTEDMFDIN